MELILISDTKLKVMLSEDDMKQYDLNCDDIDYENTETRKAFWNILDEAKNRTGFDASGDRVFVQVYPSKKGGCELFVTKLGNIMDREKRKKQRQNGISSLAVRIRDEKFNRKFHFFRFSNMEQLLNACAQLKKNHYSQSSSAYSADYDSTYYLELFEEYHTDSVNIAEEKDMDFFNSLMCEYGFPCSKETELYINEYCHCIREEDAAEVLGNLAV